MSAVTLSPSAMVRVLAGHRRLPDARRPSGFQDGVTMMWAECYCGWPGRRRALVEGWHVGRVLATIDRDYEQHLVERLTAEAQVDVGGPPGRTLAQPYELP